MRLHQLPYFNAIINNADRFMRLMLAFNESSPHSAAQFIRSVHEERFKNPNAIKRIDEFAREIRNRINDGEAVNGLAMVTMRIITSYFAYGDVGRLQQMMSLISDCDDDDDCVELMEDEVGIARCSDCDCWEYTRELHETYNTSGERTVCRECINNNYQFLERYDAYVYSDDIVRAIDEDGDHVSVHRDDEDFVWNDDLDIRTHVDYEHVPEVIGAYHSSKASFRKKADEWTRTYKRFLGVELEVEMINSGANAKTKANDLNELINDGDIGRNVFFERDGSLSNGFEIISHPQSLPAHREMWKWLQDKAAIKGLVSHKSTSCGLHIHVNRDTLTKLQIAKMVAFVNNPNNAEFMTALARRYGSAMTGYCRIKAEKAQVKPPNSSDRYEAVNVTPERTIEFRIFKGTLKYESLVAALEFVHALCEYTATCGECSVSDLSYESFLNFAEKKLSKETQTLRSYINNRLETV